VDRDFDLISRLACAPLLMILLMSAWTPALMAQDGSGTGRPGPRVVERAEGDSGEVVDNGSAQPPDTIWTLVEASGSIGAMIILLSVAGLALILEHALTIRRSVLIPKGLPEELQSHITQDDFVKAEQLCKLRPSYLSYVVLSGLQEVRIGYRAVEKAMEDASQEQAARLFRKVEYLALIANIAPMLGLLGTVYGILLAFKKIAETQGAAVAADMAGGVYLALVTTVEGLLVGIPALGAYAIFRARVEQLSSEVGLVAEQVFNNYKRSRAVKKLARREANSRDD
jgi:biopolymer transport protein ExbB